MKKSTLGRFAVLTVSAFLAWSASAQAKPAAPPAPMPAAKTPHVSKLDKMAQDLSLTPAQKTRIKPILDSSSAQIKAIRVKTDAQIEAVLNAAQKSKYEASIHRGKKKSPKKA